MGVTALLPDRAPKTPGNRSSSFVSDYNIYMFSGTYVKGLIHSMDEYYQMSSGLVMLQTTNGIYNYTLFNLITHESLLCWQRVRVASMMARSGQEWYEAFRKYNSGTHVNNSIV